MAERQIGITTEKMSEAVTNIIKLMPQLGEKRNTSNQKQPQSNDISKASVNKHDKKYIREIDTC